MRKLYLNTSLITKPTSKLCFTEFERTKDNLTSDGINEKVSKLKSKTTIIVNEPESFTIAKLLLSQQ